MTTRSVELLIAGGESDPNTQRVVDQAHLRGVDYVFWDTDQPGANQIAWDFDSPEIDLGEQQFRPAAVFNRFNVFGGEPAINHAVFETIEAYALAWPELRLLNRNMTGDTNNKSRNLMLARSIGFQIPETTVLANLSPLAGHPDGKQRIVKPLSGGDHAYVVADLVSGQAHLAEMVPQFVQEKLDGENLRVFSIGGDLFAFHLQTSEVDYRTDDNVRVDAIDLPASIVESTEELVRQLGFDYCALDFRCRDGFQDLVFLEINSFPMFVAFDDACQNRLADAVLQCLTSTKFSPLPK